MAGLFELEEAPIRLTARGEWLHGGVPLHPRVAELFAKSIACDGERYSIALGHWTSPLEVEDAAYFVRTLRRGEDQVLLALSDGRQEPLDPSTLMQSRQHTLYCRVRRGAWSVPCRFSPQQYHELALAHGAEDGTFTLAGRRFPLAPYEPRPLPLGP